MSIPIPSQPPPPPSAAGLKDYADHCSSADSGVSSVSAAARFVNLNHTEPFAQGILLLLLLTVTVSGLIKSVIVSDVSL